MKKVVFIAAMLLVVCSAMAMADTTNWTFGVFASGTNGTNAFAGDRWNVVGVWSTYTDALNSTSLTFGSLKPGAEGSAPPASPGDWIGVRQATTPVGTVDMRAKFAASPTPTTKTWTMSVGWYQVNSTNAAPTSIDIEIKPDVDKTGAAITGVAGDLPDVDGSLTYFYDVSVNNGAVTTYRASELANGLSIHIASPHTLAAPDTLTLTVRTVVPEPGSLLAMGSGLIGLMGFAIRRRK